MATVQETQDFLDEAGAPSILTPDEGKDAVKGFVDTGAKIDDQVTLLSRLMQAAEIEEPNEELLGLFPEGFNKFGAMQRESSRATKALREIVAIYREYQQWYERLKNAAEDAGYTV